jgi:hypothetical protein
MAPGSIHPLANASANAHWELVGLASRKSNLVSIYWPPHQHIVRSESIVLRITFDVGPDVRGSDRSTNRVSIRDSWDRSNSRTTDIGSE